MQSRSIAWLVAISFPIWFVPLWAGLWKLAGLTFVGVTTATGGLLLTMVLVAAYTDAESAKIPNWITYTGVAWALLLNSLHTLLVDESTDHWLGTVGIGQSLLGFATLFIGLLVIFSFSGGGAGDVKLVGAIGAFLGLQNGIEAVLIAFIFCAVISLVLTLSRRLVKSSSGLQQSISGEREMLNQKIRLGPFFAIGTILILCRESGMLSFTLLGS
jgi:Flp pilus assembly protein protease CpaA